MDFLKKKKIMRKIEKFQLNPDFKLGVRLFDKYGNYFDVEYEENTAINIQMELSKIEKPKASIWDMTKTLLEEKSEEFDCIISHQVDGEYFSYIKFQDDEKYNFRVTDLLIMFFYDENHPILADDSLFTTIIKLEDKDDLEAKLAEALEKDDFEVAKQIQEKLNQLGGN